MPLSDRRRRTLVRTLFVVFGVLPIAATVLWIFVLRSDYYRSRWEAGLSEGFGLRVTLDEVRYPRPDVVLLRGLKGYDRDTDQLLVEAVTAEADSSGETLHIVAAQPTIYADHAAPLITALIRKLKGSLPNFADQIRFEAADLTWHTAVEAQTLHDVQASAGDVDGAEQVLVNFRLPGSTAEQPVAVRIAKRGDARAAATSLEFDTGPAAIPCSLLTPLTEAAAILGPQAKYAGQVSAQLTADGWDGQVAGDLTDVDLDTLVSSRLPHLLSGTAALRIHRAELVRGRLERGQLTIVAGPGQVSRSLVATGGLCLGLAAPDAPLPNDSMLLYDRLACDVTLAGGDLTVRARTPEQPGAVLWKDALVYWREPAGGPQPTANLLRALVPFHELQVPAVLQTAGLMQWLPLARPQPAKPAATPTGSLPSPHIRVRGKTE